MRAIAIPLGLVAASAVIGGCFQPESVSCGKDGPFCPAGWVCVAELNACLDPDATLCGNGTVDGDEQCDDGNYANHDACNWNCELPSCGDGFKDGEEVCDDGGNVNGDGCNAECTSEETCGDFVRNNYVHADGTKEAEDCDEGGVDTATCNADCSKAVGSPGTELEFAL